MKKIDRNGRLVVPSHMYKKLGLNNGDSVNIECEGNRIIITNPKVDDIKSKILDHLKEIGEEYAIDELDAVIKNIEHFL